MRSPNVSQQIVFSSAVVGTRGTLERPLPTVSSEVQAKPELVTIFNQMEVGLTVPRQLLQVLVKLIPKPDGASGP